MPKIETWSIVVRYAGKFIQVDFSSRRGLSGPLLSCGVAGPLAFDQD